MEGDSPPIPFLFRYSNERQNRMSNRITELIQKYSAEYKTTLFTAAHLPKVDVIPTGYYSFDTLLSGSIGGLPRGRVTEGHGFEGSSKSNWGMAVAAQAMKNDPDFICLWLDVEGTFDVNWAEKMGMDLERVIMFPDLYWAEDYHEKLKWGIIHDIDLIVLDSVAALVPTIIGERLVAKGADGRRLADQTKAPTSERQLKMNEKLARAMFISQVIQPDLQAGFEVRGKKYRLRDSKSAVYLINQLRLNPDAGYKSVDHVTPGGIALRHLAALRIQFTKIGVSKERNAMGDPFHQRIRMYCVKNKCGVPFRTINMVLNLEGGFKEEDEMLINKALELGVIAVKGGGYYIVVETGEQIRGKDRIAEYLSQHNKIFDKVDHADLGYGEEEDNEELPEEGFDMQAFKKQMEGIG